ncbi:hypothetical protein BGW41_007849 [Actinomortierella wolfii]|nr:hypothetical protein BGW41_007849 [Actinomortierella wolfii]
MASTPRQTRVSSRIAANQLLQQQQQELQQKHQQQLATTSRSSSAAHSRAGSPSPRSGSRAGSSDSFANGHLTNGQHHHRGQFEGDSDSHTEANGVLDQGGKTMEIDDEAFKDRSVLSMWEFAFIFGFLLKFKLLLRQNYPLHNISEQDLETALFATSKNDTIEQIHCNLLSNMQNRKKAVESSSWQRAMSETLDAKIRTGEFEFENPLRYYHNYYLIPPSDRIQILKSLIDWVLQESVTIRQGLEEAKDVYLVQPFGTDQTKCVYWYFGEGSTKMYKESNPNKKNAKWETVASSLEDMKQLTDTFGKSTSNAEKALCNRIQTEIIEPIEEKQLEELKRAERAEKKMLRLAKFHEMAAMRTTRTRSSNRTNVVKYNYDDDDDIDFELEEEAYVAYTPRGRGQQQQQQQQQQEEQKQQQQQQQLEQQAEPLTGDTVMDIETQSVPPGRIDKDDEEDRKSDTSISIALERTRVGESSESDRSPKRMKVEEVQILVSNLPPSSIPLDSTAEQTPASGPLTTSTTQSAPGAVSQ